MDIETVLRLTYLSSKTKTLVENSCEMFLQETVELNLGLFFTKNSLRHHFLVTPKQRKVKWQKQVGFNKKFD